MRRRILSAAVLLVMIGLPVAAVGAQEKGAEKKQQDPSGMGQLTPEQQAMMAEYMASMQPGEHHKHLDYFVGTWDTTTKMYMGGPGSRPMESAGVSKRKWVLGGRYIMDEFKGTMMGQPYEGIGFTGYDNFKNLYVSSWASNMDTQMLTMKGMRHPETGVFTYYGDMDEPMLDVYGRTVKYVTRIVDEDNFVFEIVDLHADDDYKVVEISYKRRK